MLLHGRECQRSAVPSLRAFAPRAASPSAGKLAAQHLDIAHREAFLHRDVGPACGGIVPPDQRAGMADAQLAHVPNQGSRHGGRQVSNRMQCWRPWLRRFFTEPSGRCTAWIITPPSSSESPADRPTRFLDRVEKSLALAGFSLGSAPAPSTLANATSGCATSGRNFPWQPRLFAPRGPSVARPATS